MTIDKIIVFLFSIILFLSQNHLVFADELDQASSSAKVSAKVYEDAIIKDKIKKRLSEVGKIDSTYVKNLLTNDYFKEEVMETDFGYLIVTGRTGMAEGSIQKGKYTVSIKAIPNFDIQIPSMVDISSDGTIPIFVKNGTGKIEKGDVLNLKEQNSSTNEEFNYSDSFTDVTLVIIDEAKNLLPWAKFEVKLTKTNQKQAINLLLGWNLVTLTALPAQAMTASTLIAEIAKQGGYATTVSSLENGFWKSYVVRGDKTYSGEDFGIEPGKAYFVKAEKKSTFTFAGQNFVAPVKLKLASGWNAVGLPFTSKAYKAADLPVEMAARWESGLWDTFVKQTQEEFGENFVIAKNRGYLVKLDQGKEFSP